MVTLDDVLESAARGGDRFCAALEDVLDVQPEAAEVAVERHLLGVLLPGGHDRVVEVGLAARIPAGLDVERRAELTVRIGVVRCHQPIRAGAEVVRDERVGRADRDHPVDVRADGMAARAGRCLRWDDAQIPTLGVAQGIRPDRVAVGERVCGVTGLVRRQWVVQAGNEAARVAAEEKERRNHRDAPPTPCPAGLPHACPPLEPSAEWQGLIIGAAPHPNIGNLRQLRTRPRR